ncbi:MAG: hypothetical protein GY913_06780 [Proteobacteria bacterium]|nr:hypothetical protein [Pseudomonadota bacterium]MCP4916611.1 hypothetical protein [Pseudomonadota bacterium]
MLPLLLACTSTTPEADPCVVGETPWLELGTGEIAFETLPDEPLKLIHGPQGGYHVILAVEAGHFDQSTWVYGVLEGSVDGQVVAHTEPFVTLRCNANAGAQQGWNLFLILEEGMLPEDVHDQTLDVTAVLTDQAGNTASAEATIDVWDPALE